MATVTVFERGSDTSYPFTEPPSGSKWNTNHLRWLGVIISDALPLEDVLNTADSWLPSDTGVFVQEARKRLAWPQGDIILQSMRRLHSDNTFYNALSEFLIPTVPIGLGDYSPSSPNSPTIPPEVEMRSVQDVPFGSSPPLPRRSSSSGSSPQRLRGSSDTDLDPSYSPRLPSSPRDQVAVPVAENIIRETQAMPVVKAFREVMSSIVASCNKDFANTLQH